MERKKVYFITGIDTDAGKSFATGYIARLWAMSGESVITQKMIQTGCYGISEDIVTHRRIMGTGLLPEDTDNTTCPIRFTYPSSPDLASRLETREVDLGAVDRSTGILLGKYDTVLIEGAGGLLVPVSGSYLTADYITEKDYPVILVTSARLGSINHTLLTIEACLSRGIRIEYIAYNNFPEQSQEICRDTRAYLQRYMAGNLPGCQWIEIPKIDIT